MYKVFFILISLFGCRCAELKPVNNPVGKVKFRAKECAALRWDGGYERQSDVIEIISVDSNYRVGDTVIYGEFYRRYHLLQKLKQ